MLSFDGYIPTQKTMVDDNPLPVNSPSLELMAPWVDVDTPPMTQRRAQKMTLSRMDILVCLMDRIDDCRDSILMLESSAACDVLSCCMAGMAVLRYFVEE